MKIYLFYLNVMLLMFAFSIKASSSSSSSSAGASASATGSQAKLKQAQLKSDPSIDECNLLLQLQKDNEKALLEKQQKLADLETQMDALNQQKKIADKEKYDLQIKQNMLNDKLKQNSYWRSLNAVEISRQKEEEDLKIRAEQARKLILSVPVHINTSEKPIHVRGLIARKGGKMVNIFLYPSDNILTIFRQLFENHAIEPELLSIKLHGIVEIELRPQKTTIRDLKLKESSDVIHIVNPKKHKYSNEELLKIYDTQMGIDK